MVGRFTNRARKVMDLANTEANRFNSDYIKTEHVLLGLLKTERGVGTTVLENYGVDLNKLRLELELKVISGKDITKDVAVSRLPQTPKVKSLIDKAMKYAQKLNCNYIGTEHLLYGLIADKDTVTSQILMGFGLNEDKLTKGIEGLCGVCNNLDSLQENEGLQAPNYWTIPRGNIDIVQFLQLSGHEVIGGRNGKENILIESKGCLIGRLNPPEYTSGTVVYNAKDGDQLKKALGLRDVFDLNKIEYIEEPSASEVAKELREVARALGEAVKHSYGLADSLEKRV